MARAISKQRWKEVHNSRINCEPIFLHVVFGLPNGKNDTNVLNQSLIVINMIKGVDYDLKFKMNDKSYLWYYLLVDGVYPPWPCFMQTIHEQKSPHFAKIQECARKNVSKKCFGVLQSRFEVIQNPCRWCGKWM